MLLKTLLGVRLAQTPLSFIFLIAVSWTLYLVQHSPETQSQPTHIVTTISRFLTPIITIPYVSYEAYGAFLVLRGRDVNGKFALQSKSRTYKISRVLLEFGLAGLWFLSFVFSLGVNSWSLTGDDRVMTSSDSSVATNGTMTTTTGGNAAVIPPDAQNTFIVPPGGKTPMVLGSLMWVVIIGLFTVSSLTVVIQTARNWRNAKPSAVMYEQEMEGHMKGEAV